MQETTSTSPKRTANLSMRFSQFQIPPVRDALIIGKRAPIGANGITRALAELTPGAFRLISVDHPIVEAIVVRESDLRKVPEEILIPRLLAQAGTFMDETDALHVTISIEVVVENEWVEL